MLATLDGIGPARQLEHRCQSDFAYMWICGGVGFNYHTLYDLRSRQAEFLERLMVDSVATQVY